MGIITLKSIRFQAKHGVLPHEKVDRHDFEVDVIADVDILHAAQTDDLAHTLDYGRAALIVGDVMNGASVDLIETLAYRIGNGLISAFPAMRELTVAVRKLHPPIDDDAAYSEVRETWRM
jgi:dihydroneopterin aldolase